MKQLLHNYRAGRLQIKEVLISALSSHHVVIRTAASLASIGTEKYILEMARKSLLGKAFARPDLVRQVIAKTQAERIPKTGKRHA